MSQSVVNTPSETTSSSSQDKPTRQEAAGETQEPTRPQDNQHNQENTSTDDPREPITPTQELAPDTQRNPTRLVPVSEAIRYRKRAQAAEQQFTDMQQQLQNSQSQLNEAAATIETFKQRQAIDSALNSASVIDIQVARMLVNGSIEQIDVSSKTDDLALENVVQVAVDSLRREKPYLFRQANSTQAAAMSMRQPTGIRAAEDSAQTAATTGNRRDLLRYLRLRRGA